MWASPSARTFTDERTVWSRSLGTVKRVAGCYLQAAKVAKVCAPEAIMRVYRFSTSLRSQDLVMHATNLTMAHSLPIVAHSNAHADVQVWLPWVRHPGRAALLA